MYDASSRIELKEHADYEGWLIDECLDRLRREQGWSDPLVIEVRDDGNNMLLVELHDELGAASAAEVVRDLVPIVFASAFKILDMVMEWCLLENGASPKSKFFSFVEKIQHARAGRIAVWPDFLSSDAHLQRVVVETYTSLRQKRNAIIHRGWGKNTEGDLAFDVRYVDDLDPAKPSVHDQDVVPLGVTISMCEFSAVLLDRLCNPAKQVSSDLDTLRRLANEFRQLHHQPIVPVAQHRFYVVIRKTASDLIDIDAIVEKSVKPQAQLASFSYELRIERRDERWVVPPPVTAGLTGQVPLVDLAPYKV